jgi:signal transduction histidine kinase
MKTIGLRAKIVRVFAFQVVIIGVATLLGIYVTNTIVQDVLSRAALDGEAGHYWDLYRDNPSQPLPDTDNMRGYLARGGSDAGIPVELGPLGVGFHRAKVGGTDKIVHVSDEGDDLLYLVFDSGRVSTLAFYFGILPLSVVLLLIYSVLFVTFRLSQNAISPIVRLARFLEDFEFNSIARGLPDLTHLRGQSDSEVATMIEAVEHFATRLNAFIERERVFTRDASHELRTPLAVFKGSLDLLERDGDRRQGDLDALRRMRRTVEEMEGLISTLLLLAREESHALPTSEVVVNEIAAEQVDQLRPMASRNGNVIGLTENALLSVEAPAEVIRIIVSNLLRNAISYTRDGKIEIVIGVGSLTVRDTGIGMSEEELEHVFEPFFRADNGRSLSRGHGLGLPIVRRLVAEHGWELRVRSRLEAGTQLEIVFQP